jgi:hypothetical protein
LLLFLFLSSVLEENITINKIDQASLENLVLLTEHPMESEPQRATMELTTTTGVAFQSLGATSSSQVTLASAVKSPSSGLSLSIFFPFLR